MTGSAPGPALTPAQTRTAEALLERAWGGRVRVRAAETIWGRDHIVRLHLGAGRSAVLKRRNRHNHHGGTLAFGVELAALEFLSAMPVPVAPRLLGADPRAGILVMEDLGPGASLAGALLGGERERAEAGLVGYAEALGSLHAWSMRRPGELASLRARHARRAPARPAREGLLEKGREPFLALAGTFGLTTGGAAGEIEEIGPALTRASPPGLVHGDPCPDNVRLTDGGCRIFDFETAAWGPVVLDAAYLVAPFPSCWCFASLPAEAAGPALEAYRGRLQDAGASLGRDWDVAMTAALAWGVVARGRGIAAALEADRDWGTTTMRPRMLAWLSSFIRQAGRTGSFPRLHALADALHDQLSRRWPDARIPGYPALAGPGSALARVPDGWQPDD